MRRFLYFVAVATLLFYVSANPAASKKRIAAYSVVLNTVESPANAKEQFGETKVVNFEEAGISKYRYEDDYISIVWYVDPKKFNFTITNKTDYTLKLIWDDMSFVDIYGRSRRLMHSSVILRDRYNSQPATTVPKGASVTDYLIPPDNIQFIAAGFNSRWEEAYLIPCIYKKKDDYIREAPMYVGKTMSVLMPISIENVQNDYTFNFSIDEFLNPED